MPSVPSMWPLSRKRTYVVPHGKISGREVWSEDLEIEPPLAPPLGLPPGSAKAQDDALESGPLGGGVGLAECEAPTSSRPMRQGLTDLPLGALASGAGAATATPSSARSVPGAPASARSGASGSMSSRTWSGPVPKRPAASRVSSAFAASKAMAAAARARMTPRLSSRGSPQPDEEESPRSAAFFSSQARAQARVQTSVLQTVPESPAALLAEHAGTEAEMAALTRQLLTAVYEQSLQDGQVFAALEMCPELGWLAQCAANAPLPAGWQKCSDAGQPSYGFFNTETSEIQEALPNMSQFVTLGRLAMHARQRPADAGLARTWVNAARDDAQRQSWHAQEGWTGPHTDTATGAEYYHKAETGMSSWGSPSAAAAAPSYIAHVANGLLQSEAFPKDCAVEPELREEALEQRQSEFAPPSRERVKAGDVPPHADKLVAQTAQTFAQRVVEHSTRAPSVPRVRIKEALRDQQYKESGSRHQQRSSADHEEAALPYPESSKMATHQRAASPEGDPMSKAQVFDIYTDRSHCEREPASKAHVFDLYTDRSHCEREPTSKAHVFDLYTDRSHCEREATSKGHVFDLYTDRSHCESVSSVYGGPRSSAERFDICTPRDQSLASVAYAGSTASGMNEHAVMKLAEAAAAVAAAAAALAGAGQASKSLPLAEAQQSLQRAYDAHAVDSFPVKTHTSLPIVFEHPPSSHSRSELIRTNPSSPRKRLSEAAGSLEVLAAATPSRKHGTSVRAKTGLAAFASAVIESPRPKLHVHETWSPDSSAADSFEFPVGDRDRLDREDLWSPDSSATEREPSVLEQGYMDGSVSPLMLAQTFELSTPPPTSPVVRQQAPAAAEVQRSDECFPVAEPTPAAEAAPTIQPPVSEDVTSSAVVDILASIDALPDVPPDVPAEVEEAMESKAAFAAFEAPPATLGAASTEAAGASTRAPIVALVADEAPAAAEASAEASAALEARAAAQEARVGMAVATVSGISAHGASDSAGSRKASSMRDPRGPSPLRGLRSLPPSLASAKPAPPAAAATAAAAPAAVTTASTSAGVAPAPKLVLPGPMAVPLPPPGPPPAVVPQPPVGNPPPVSPAAAKSSATGPVFPWPAPPVSPRLEVTPPQSARSAAGLRKADAGASGGYPRAEAPAPMVGGA